MISWNLTERQMCDVEMLLSGAFAPLTGFLTKEDYASVVNNMRLVSGQLWPMPITLDVSKQFADSIETGSQIALHDSEGVLIATMDVESIWVPNKLDEAVKVFGSDNSMHPTVDYLFNKVGDCYIGGGLLKVEFPQHFDYPSIRHTPSELKQVFERKSWDKIIALQVQVPLHSMHCKLTLQVMQELEAQLLIIPIVGMEDLSNINHYANIRCHQHVANRFPKGTAMLNLLNLAVRMSGLREYIWHAIIHKNYGCNHMILDEGNVKLEENVSGECPYDVFDAQDILAKYQGEIGIDIISLERRFDAQHCYSVKSRGNADESPPQLPSVELKHCLEEGLAIPEWQYSEVVGELRKVYKPRYKQGFTIFCTGLSGSGKSTIASGLVAKLLEMGSRPVTLLDGDVIRKNLSSELSFSKEHRDLNVRRIGFIASEITKHGGISVCSSIAPYIDTREEVRAMIQKYGGFVEVYVSTPVGECEKRDRKGLYAKAREGKIRNFTGVTDPYEEPKNPELNLDTTNTSLDECIGKILFWLKGAGFIR